MRSRSRHLQRGHVIVVAHVLGGLAELQEQSLNRAMSPPRPGRARLWQQFSTWMGIVGSLARPSTNRSNCRRVSTADCGASSRCHERSVLCCMSVTILYNARQSSSDRNKVLKFCAAPVSSWFAFTFLSTRTRRTRCVSQSVASWRAQNPNANWASLSPTLNVCRSASTSIAR